MDIWQQKHVSFSSEPQKNFAQFGSSLAAIRTEIRLRLSACCAVWTAIYLFGGILTGLRVSINEFGCVMHFRQHQRSDCCRSNVEVTILFPKKEQNAQFPDTKIREHERVRQR